MSILRFTDSDGTEWQVFEVHRSSNAPFAVRQSFEGGWLSFTHDEERRRLAPIPDGWDGFDAGALETLCQHAVRVDSQRVQEFLDHRDRERRRAPQESGDNPTQPTVMQPAARDPDVRLPPDVKAIAEELARSVRGEARTVVSGLVELRQLLGARGIGHDTNVFRAARRVFLDGYYFNRERPNPV